MRNEYRAIIVVVGELADKVVAFAFADCTSVLALITAAFSILAATVDAIEVHTLAAAVVTFDRP
jgi:hypothetical protein